MLMSNINVLTDGIYESLMDEDSKSRITAIS